MLNARVTKIIESFRLPKSDREELDRILKRPEVQAVFHADEREQIEHRKTLIKELKAIPAIVDKKKSTLEKEHAAVAQRLEAAEKEYREAKKAFNEASLADHYAGYQDNLRAKHIEHELTAGADPRIAEYRFELGNIIGRARSKFEFWQGHTPKNILGQRDVTYHSNVDDVAQARKELDKGLVTLRELELSAITTGEMTQALKDLSSTLKGSLNKLEMHPPTIDEHGNVEPAQRDGTRVIEQKEPETSRRQRAH
ncbi:MAG: hypothetical protein PHF31_05785 [Methylobacter sp.]|nr:hypothetical protein [Methylobacter sp.]